MMLRLLIGSTSMIALAAGVPAGQEKVDLSVKAIVASATRYVVDYETKFKFVVADEAYTQTTYDGRGEQTGIRRMSGEMFLTFIPADEAWMAVHDFAVVDGEPVPDREDLRALLQKGETASVVRRVRERNARYNLGSIIRNVNEPTLPLLILEPKRVKGFSFNREEVLQTDGRTTVRLSYRERDRPTLVRNIRGGALFSRGELTVGAGTGRIERTIMEFSQNGITARLTTTYAHDEKVEMWVPVSFTERYESRGEDREVIVCEAAYTNFRKFEATARIKR
ncbi:MAG: hypothetical protein ACM4AI_20820 [Acidobacteriota bacterium]